MCKGSGIPKNVQLWFYSGSNANSHFPLPTHTEHTTSNEPSDSGSDGFFFCPPASHGAQSHKQPAGEQHPKSTDKIA